MKESLRQQDYHKVFQKRGDCIRLLAQTSGVVIFFAWFFYRSIWAVPLLFPLGILYFRRCVNRQCRKNRQELTMQFKECILSVANSLRSGYALENAFLESREDIRMLYGEHSAMYRELELIRRGMILNITLEELISDEYKINILGERIGMGDSMMMKDIHCWCTRQNIRYRTKFKYRKDYPILANIWNLYSYCRFRCDLKR